MHARVETFRKTSLHNGNEINIIFLNRGDIVRPRMRPRVQTRLIASLQQHHNKSTNNQITISTYHQINISTNHQI